MMKMCAIMSAATLLVASSANASMISLAGNGAWGSYTGTASFVTINANTGTLTLTLTNTSPLANGGFLTGVAVEFAPAVLTGTLSSTSDSDFVGLTNVSASPFGTYDIGAATGGSWEGGGPPSRGTGVGATLTLGWTVTGPGAGSFNVNTFNLDGSDDASIVVRFRGFGNGESDKVPAVPAPGALALAGLGVLAAGRRKR